MKRSPLLMIVAVSLPLLVVAGYLFVSSGSSSSTADPGFVHPPVAGQNATGMIRARDGEVISPSSPAAPAPSSDNVSDRYFHEIFVLEEAIRTNPDDTTSMAKLGRLLQDGHDLEKSESAYTSYLERRRGSKQIWLDLTAVQAAQKNFAAAENTLNEMLNVYTGDEMARYNLGALAANDGRADEARKIWTTLSGETTDNTLKTRIAGSLQRLSAGQ